MTCALASRSTCASCSARHGLVVGEVEAQAVGADERTGLLHVRAEHLAQRPVQHVGGGVIAADAIAAHTVDLGLDLVALGDHADAHPPAVHGDLAREPVLRVDDVDDRAGRGRDRAGVADLATRLRVERRAVEHDVDLEALGRLADALAADEQREHLRVRRVLLAAGELGRHRACRRARGTPRAARPARRRPRPRRRGPARAAPASRSSKPARSTARPRSPAISRVRSIGKPSVSCRKNASSPETSLLVDDLGEHVDAALQRGAERLFLALDDLAHDLVRRRDLGVRVAHRGDDRVDHRGQHDVARAEQVRVPHRAPDDAAQHVAALLVRRPHAVAHHEGHRARVLGDDAQRHVGRSRSCRSARR